MVFGGLGILKIYKYISQNVKLITLLAPRSDYTNSHIIFYSVYERSKYQMGPTIMGSIIRRL
ncbi:hypothetical protein, partial [Gracilibacillus dipsosauri]|uniref:hypothetical protein n=1 Tax=Gracilibacillus dipsosauri TaxID=178340 RepID=UPI00240A2C4A